MPYYKKPSKFTDQTYEAMVEELVGGRKYIVTFPSKHHLDKYMQQARSETGRWKLYREFDGLAKAGMGFKLDKRPPPWKSLVPRKVTIIKQPLSPTASSFTPSTPTESRPSSPNSPGLKSINDGRQK